MNSVDEIREAALRRAVIWRTLDVDPASEVIQDAAKCDRCGESPAKRQRQNTAYHVDSMNWATLCPKCQTEADEYWRERWDEYYSNCL